MKLGSLLSARCRHHSMTSSSMEGHTSLSTALVWVFSTGNQYDQLIEWSALQEIMHKNVPMFIDASFTFWLKHVEKKLKIFQWLVQAANTFQPDTQKLKLTNAVTLLNDLESFLSKSALWFLRVVHILFRLLHQ